MKTTSELRACSLESMCEVLFKDIFISFVSISISILHLTPICNCSNVQTHTLWFMGVLKHSVWWASIPGLGCLNLCCQQGSHSFLPCGKELVWSNQEALRERYSIIYKLNASSEIFGSGNMVKMKSKLVSVSSLIGKAANKSDDGIMSYCVWAFYITILYHKSNSVQGISSLIFWPLWNGYFPWVS